MMYRTMTVAAVLLAGTAHAQVAMVPALLPPPVMTQDTLHGGTTAVQGEVVQVPVLKQAVQRGQSIAAENLTLVDVPASKVFASTVTDTAELVGQQALRPLEAGKAVNRLHVRVAPVVSRNQMVTLVYRKGGIELSGTAQALEDGQKGQTIRIVNPATRSTLTGTVTADGVVEVN